LAASSISASGGTLNGSVNPQGAAVKVSFQYGPTTAYGQTTAPHSTGVSNAPTAFSAQLTGLPAGTTVHYRAIAVSDFGTFVGADQTLTTLSVVPPPGSGKATVGRARIVGSTAKVRVSCAGPSGATCALTLELTVTEKFKGHRLTAVTARSHRPKTTGRTVVVGAATALLQAGQTQTVQIALNRTGQRLLKSRHRLKATLRVTQTTNTGATVTVSQEVVTFKASHRRNRHGRH
jgi:hypothetical protein